MIRLLRFGVAGVIGFLVDAGILTLLVGPLGIDPYLARVPSFLAAATTTWLVNRHWTFADRGGGVAGGQWGRYVLAMLAGGAVNYATYAALIATVPLARAWPVLGVAAGSLAGMAVNYASSNWWIFRARHERRDPAPR